MNVRSVVGTPITAIVFLILSIWPGSIVAGALPSGWKLFGIPVVFAVASGFTQLHREFDGTPGDAGAYFFWVYAIAILVSAVGQLITAAFGVVIVLDSVLYLLAKAAHVLVTYASAWWLVYEDGWARIRPLNWGGDGQSSSDG